ncbi:unnamed protein product [Rotaria sp. Silwood2]|nr:unnamed protein product [Rotaria sp. Silwood2]CAF4507218.1 unnamed protein product [Rotaria sp. Silwood2]
MWDSNGVKYNGYLINFKSIVKRHFDLVCRLIRSDQIDSLTLLDSNDTPGQSKLFRSLFPIGQWIHLRALTLINIDQNFLPAFAHLHKFECLVSIAIHPICQFSFELIAAELKHPIVNSDPNEYSDHETLISPIQLSCLYYLTLTQCPFVWFYRILRLEPNFISVNVSITR